MSRTNRLDFRPVNSKDKRLAVLAVISFHDACPTNYSRAKVAEYFGVHERTVRTWTSQAATTQAPQSPQQPELSPDAPVAQGIKRSRSEEAITDAPSAPITSGSQKGHKAARKPAQGQKKRKTSIKNEILTPSPPPSPQQLLTPPRRTPSKRKQRGAENTMSQVQYADDSSDEYTPFESIQVDGKFVLKGN